MSRIFTLCFLLGSLVMTTDLPAQSTSAFPAVDQLPAIEGLPDLLTMRDGTKVATKEDWFNKRRPEIKALVQHYMYGVPPSAPEKIEATELFRDSAYLNGKATLRETLLTFGPGGKGKINLLLITPNGKGKSPVFIGTNFFGNHQVIADDRVAIPSVWVPDRCQGCKGNKASAEGRGSQAEAWSADLLIERGYALASFYCGDLDPDKPDWSDGIHPAYYKEGQTAPAPSEWHSIAAWAWGVSRVIDHLATDPTIDSSRIGSFGHSRLGKTALLSGALDERIAIVCPHQSGTGGMAITRKSDQETAERINKVFPHWFNGEFKTFVGKEERLPIDQHCLVALCAPRPVLATEGEQDAWANFPAGWRTLQAADPVYKLLGLRGLKADHPISQDEPFTAENFGELMQYRRNEKHHVSRAYWTRILDFADRWYAERSK